MRIRWRQGVALLVACSAMAGTAWAAPPAEPDAGTAQAWLARIHAAANGRNYEGTMVFTAGGVTSSSRVAHYGVGDQTYERIEALDGRMHRIYRHNDVVQTVWPQAGIVVIERRSALVALPSVRQSVEPRALEQYQLEVLGKERIAGREAQALHLKPRDNLRFAQRLWADTATGLMLRADVLGEQREVLESLAFSQIELGVKPQPDAILQAMKKPEGSRVLRPQQLSTRLEAEGWMLKATVPGFQLASCVKRPLEAASPDGVAPRAQVLQAVFSDGLTHVSLFIEPYDAMRHRKELQAHLGATHTLMLRRDEHWLTIMGDVPMATLQFFARSLERRP